MTNEVLQELFDTAYELLKREFPSIKSKPQVNTGYCRLYALRVTELAEEHGIEFELRSQRQRHTWLYRDGKHYDAETGADGVNHPSDLPVFRVRTEFKPDQVEPGIHTQDDVHGAPDWVRQAA